MNQQIKNSIKVPKVVKPTNKKNVNIKRWIPWQKQPNVPPLPSLQKGSKYLIQVVLKVKLITDPVKVYN